MNESAAEQENQPRPPTNAAVATQKNTTHTSITQSQHSSFRPSSSTNNPIDSSINTEDEDDESNSTPPTTHHTSTPLGLVRLHHEQSSNFVLKPYCRPISDTFNPPKNISCKYTRQCIVLKSKVLSLGDHIPSLSETAYKNKIPFTKINYINMDTRFVHCVNKSCKSTNPKLSKCFHFICYKHMMSTCKKDAMKEFVFRGPSDKIKEQLHKGIDIQSIHKSIEDDSTKLIIPVCGKRCYNSVCKKLKKSKETINGMTTYEKIKSWDKDGDKNRKSSIEILIEWITTEENASKYFGGLDIDGRTSSTRKEAYHHHIRDLIKEENGSVRTSESVRTKIVRLLQSYKIASERMNRSGEGLDGFKNTSLQEYIVREVCKYYFVLDPVLRDRPNVKAWFTNEEETSYSSGVIQNKKVKEQTELLSSDDESNNSTKVPTPKDQSTTIIEDSDNIDSPIESDIEFNTDSNYDKSFKDKSGSEDEYDTFSTISRQTQSTTHQSSNSSNSSDDNNSLLSRTPIGQKEKKTNKKRHRYNKKRLTPSQAKIMHKNLKHKNKKRSIVNKKGKSDFSTLITMDDDNRLLLIETRNKKMMYENSRHTDMKILEEKKIRIAEQRLEMEESSTRIKNETLIIQRNLEKSKIVLLKLEMFKQREAIKKNNPNITDDYLNNLFPYPE